jgi:hypothetical protein
VNAHSYVRYKTEIYSFNNIEHRLILTINDRYISAAACHSVLEFTPETSGCTDEQADTNAIHCLRAPRQLRKHFSNDPSFIKALANALLIAVSTMTTRDLAKDFMTKRKNPEFDACFIATTNCASSLPGGATFTKSSTINFALPKIKFVQVAIDLKMSAHDLVA